MRRLAAAGFLFACATARAPMLPANPGWIGGQKVAVQGPQNVGIGGPELAAQYLHDGVENDLRAMGFAVGEGGLTVAIESFERGQVRASVRGGGRELQRIELNGDLLGCVSSAWGLYANDNAQYFTDVIRQASLRIEPGLDIMTRENLVVLLQSTGKRLEECEGECEVDTGRRIGADQIISGEIQKVGTKYKMTLRLHDTRE